MIDKEDLAPEIDALTGPETLILLRTCQPHYESMVEARLTRDGRKSDDLGRVRGKVLRAVARYTNAVLSMLDERKPETLELVLTALRPLEALRAATTTTTTPPERAEPGAEPEADDDDDEPA